MADATPARRPPGAAWPHERLLHAYWVESWLLAGEYPGHEDTAAARARLELLVEHGVRTVIDLTEPADGLPAYSAALAAVAEARRVTLRHLGFPIPDFGVVDDTAYDSILTAIDAARAEGAVYVHCWGGVGRTGTVVGCHLLRRGLTYDAALATLAALRATSSKAARPAPETEAQRLVLRSRAGG